MPDQNSTSESTNPLSFRTELLLTGKNTTGIQVPEEIVAALKAGKRPPVQVTIGEHTYRTTIAVMGGDFMLSVSEENRRLAGISAGDVVDVTLALDTQPREVVVPPDLQAALAAEPEAAQFFAGLSYSNKRRIVLPIEDAKTPETRQRRIDKAVSMLREGRI